jgi:hypothetical protein
MVNLDDRSLEMVGNSASSAQTRNNLDKYTQKEKRNVAASGVGEG